MPSPTSAPGPLYWRHAGRRRATEADVDNPLIFVS